MNSIFLEFNLPNAATWFYFSMLLAVGLFLSFRRPFSLRNWDIVGLFAIIPGFLLLQEAHGILARTHSESLRADGEWKLLYAYVWLETASLYWFLRSLFDLGLVRRPYLPSNLNNDGLGWMTIALFLCLTVVAVRRMPDAPPAKGKEPIALSKVTEGATMIVAAQTGGDDMRFWVERSTALLGHLVVVIGLIRIGQRHFGDLQAGLSASCLYLLVPCTSYTVSLVHHVWPAMFITLAVLWYQHPALSGALLGAAAGTVFFPILLMPLWAGFYRARGMIRFCACFLFAMALGLAATAGLLLWSGEFWQHLKVALNLSDWQAWKRPTTEGIWKGSHWAYRLPVCIAYIAFVILTAFWPKERHLGQVIAQTAAICIGVQFWYSDQGGVYVLWYLPMLLLMIFRPNLSDVRPPEIARDTDRISLKSKAARQKLHELQTRLPKFHWPRMRIRG